MLKFHISKYPELDSTQKYARAHLEELRHGYVILAEKQTAGIGQYGRSWHSPAGGNLYLTIVLEPEKTMPSLPEITMLTARAIVSALEKMGIEGTVKPPNDVLVQGRKIAGIIGHFVPDQANSGTGKLLVGVGINVNMDIEDLAAIEQPVTSLFALLGNKQDPDAVLHDFLNAFQKLYSFPDP